jgi:hypothetical protein
LPFAALLMVFHELKIQNVSLVPYMIKLRRVLEEIIELGNYTI